MNADKIRSILTDKLNATRVIVEDDSAAHAGHVGAQEGGHYRVTVVADSFTSKALIERHRMVYAALESELGRSIHAVALKTYSPAETEDAPSAKPQLRPGKGEPMDIWIMRYPNADLWSFRASLYKRDGWLFKYPDLHGASTYGFRSYEEAAREVEKAGYRPVQSEKVETVDPDADID